MYCDFVWTITLRCTSFFAMFIYLITFRFLLKVGKYIFCKSKVGGLLEKDWSLSFSMEEITVPTQWFFQESNNSGQLPSDGSPSIPASVDSTEMRNSNKKQFYQQGISNSPQRKSSKSNPLELRLRRIRANNRERRRIQAINDAMEALRKAIPSTNNKRKLTKLELLRLAQDYIRDLSEMLCSDNSTLEEDVVNVSFSQAGYTSYFPEVCFTT